MNNDPFPNNVDCIKTVKTIIESNIDINKRYGMNDETLLHYATLADNFEMAKYLVESGATVNVKDNNLCTPLLNAATMGNIDMVKYLLDNGADVYAVDDRGFTALHGAADHIYDEGVGDDFKFDDPNHIIESNIKYVQIAKYLVELGIDVNLEDNDDMTPLHYAAKHNIQMVKCLLDSGANKGSKSDFNESTPAEIALLNGRQNIADFIRDYELVPTKGVHA